METGRHAALIQRNGPYRRLMGSQAEEREDELTFAADGPATRDYGDRGEIETSGETATDAMASAAAAVGWGATLGTLMQNGVPLLRSLDLVSEIAGNRFLEVKMIEVRRSVIDGATLSTALAAQK